MLMCKFLLGASLVAPWCLLGASLVPHWCLLGASLVPPCTTRLAPGTLRVHEKTSMILIQIDNVPRATPKDAPKAANVATQPLFYTIFGALYPSKVPFTILLAVWGGPNLFVGSGGHWEV